MSQKSNGNGDGGRIGPNVLCPHCGTSFSSGELPSRTLGKTKWGILAFQCPRCNRHIKIEPREYLYMKGRLRAGGLPEGVGIVAFEADELTPSEKLAQSAENSVANSLPRAQNYRLAGRTFRYQVYVAIEIAWNLIALFLIFREIFYTRRDPLTVALVILALLSIAHSVHMTVTQPWQLLKAITAGGLVYAITLGFFSLLGSSSNPLTFAVICGSAYYFWLGELWTQKSAIYNSAPRND